MGRDGQGLPELKLKNHFMVCGWNRNVEALLRDLQNDAGGRRGAVVLLRGLHRLERAQADFGVDRVRKGKEEVLKLSTALGLALSR